MKRAVLLIAIALTVVLYVHAQIPDPGDPVCVYCEVDLKSQQPHKRGCPYYSEPANESSSSSNSSSSSSISSKPSRPFNERTDVNLDEYGRGRYRCPECGNLHHTGSCQLGKVQSEYRRLHNEIRFSDKKWKKKAYREALDRREELWSELKRRVNDAWWKKDHPTYTSSSSSDSNSSSSSSTERIKLTYECNICKASVKAYGINEASNIFANTPWLHKQTCPEYKPKPGQNPSTSLKDYTPASERPKVSEPLMEMPLRQPAPQFSSINETNIRHEKPVEVIGVHDWGEIDEGLLFSYESEYDEEIPREFDIERYNHDKGAVILGTHEDNGRYHWTILERLSNGDLRPVSQQDLKEGRSGYKNIGELRDVHFEGQGKYIIAEFTSGYRQVYDGKGDFVRDGYNIRVLGGTVDGKSLLYVGEDEQTVASFIINEDGEVIADGHNITQYDDAYVLIGDDYPYYNIFNWHGEKLSIEGNTGFEEIKAYNNNGSYYILKDKEKGYAVVGRGFRRVGDWYDTEEEAHQAWRQSR